MFMLRYRKGFEILHHRQVELAVFASCGSGFVARVTLRAAEFLACGLSVTYTAPESLVQQL